MSRIRVGASRILAFLAVRYAELRGTLKPFTNDLLPQRVTLLADSDCVLPELGAKSLLYQENAFER